MNIKNYNTFKIYSQINTRLPKKEGHSFDPTSGMLYTDEQPKKPQQYHSVGEMLAKLTEEKLNVEKIAAKVAKGEYVSEKEKAFLEEKDPKAAQDARFAAQERKRLAEKLNGTKTQQEAKTLLHQATVAAASMVRKDGNNLGASLMIQAVNKAGADYRRKIKPKPTIPPLTKLNRSI